MCFTSFLAGGITKALNRLFSGVFSELFSGVLSAAGNRVLSGLPTEVLNRGLNRLLFRSASQGVSK